MDRGWWSRRKGKVTALSCRQCEKARISVRVATISAWTQ